MVVDGLKTAVNGGWSLGDDHQQGANKISAAELVDRRTRWKTLGFCSFYRFQERGS